MELRKNNNKVADKTKNNCAAELIKEIESHKTKNIHGGHRERLKSQFLQNGLNSLTDIQKLELLLFYAIPQKDTNPIAHNLLNKFGSLKDVIEADYLRLMETDGVKENSATLINLVNALANYYHKPSPYSYIDSSKTAINYATSLYHGASVEQFYIVCIAKNNAVVKCKLVNTGLIDEVDIQIRELTKIAIDNKVNRIVVSHNHPKGIAEMSDEDYNFTFNLICSCILNSIDVLDHVIVGTDGHCSLYEGGIIEKIKSKLYRILKVPKDKVNFLSSLSKDYIKSKVVEINYKNAD